MPRTPNNYLDYNATTPCADEVVAAMLPFFTGEFGNPGSPHAMGRWAAAAVETARDTLADLAGCLSEDLVFTSGATESNNLALLGVARRTDERTKIVISSVEHKSVLGPADWLEEQGFQVIRLPVKPDGVVDLAAADQMIDEETLLVSVQHANNETGVIQPVAEIARTAHRRGALMHSDCAQTLGKIPVDVVELEVDYASFSAHKMYGPKGIGALFISAGTPKSLIGPICYGGGQEMGLRPGTLNVPAIVGFGAACQLASEELPEVMMRIGGLRDWVEERVLDEISASRINGSDADRLPGCTSISVPGIPASAVIARMSNVCISDGSACTFGALTASHVLLAMGLSAGLADSTLRIGLGRSTSVADLEALLAPLVRTVTDVRTASEKIGKRDSGNTAQSMDSSHE